ncbi:MAG: ABC transporter permease [Balneolaceae bacterium]
MLKNYLKIAFRNFTQNKSYALLSILSLTIAITSVMLIGMYAAYELSYDKFHEKSDQIYRLTTSSINQDIEREVGFVPLPMAPHLAENFPRVKNYLRVWEYRRSMPVSNPERDLVFYEDNFGWAEDTFFEFFDFEITAGDKENPLGEFRSIVISESTAEKYFEDENPIGKPLYFQGETDIPFYVTAVMKDFPENSHFHFDFIADIKVAADDYWAGGGVGQEFFDQWVNLFVPGYILVEPGTDLEPILAEASRLENEYFNVPGSEYRVNAQPLTSIHLYSNLDVAEWEINGSAQTLYAVIIIGIIILALGCFNFINLVTAQAGKRTKEVGLRKTLGGTRSQLVSQHYLEACLMMVLAILISFGIVELILPFLNGFIPAGSIGMIVSNPATLIAVFIGVLFVILLAGAYPALFVSRFNPSDVLKGTFATAGKGSILRKTLVTLQFVLSGALIVCTLVVYKQLEFVKNKELGFSEEQIVVIPIHRDTAIIPNLNRIKDAFTQNSNIEAVTASSHLMFATFTYANTFRLQGSEQDHRWERYTVEADYTNVYDIEFIAGRSFRPDTPADTNNVILNEQAVLELGFTPEEALGRVIENRSMGNSGEIIGVAKDFHYQSLHEKIQPFVLMNRPNQIDYISVKINPEQAPETIAFMQEEWPNVVPNASFGYFFLDSTFGAIYDREERLGNAILGFSTVAIFLACLGLFGLSLFTAERRTKEIGVRKVLGASVWDIVMLLGVDFTKLIILALAIAMPVSYIVMNSWLNDFAYRIEFSLFLLVGGAMAVLITSWGTISWQSIKAAVANPVDSLKSE